MARWELTALVAVLLDGAVDVVGVVVAPPAVADL
jgi:hypothetical protein